MLIDVWGKVGLRGMAQVDLEEHRHHHQPLSALAPMAQTVLTTIAARLEGDEILEPWSERLAPEENVEWEHLEKLDPHAVVRPALADLGLARTVK